MKLRTTVLLCCLGLLFSRSVCGDEIRFNRDVRGVLSDNCFACHGQDANQRAADLRLDQRESATDSGAIVPGDPDSSELVWRILSDDPDERMPPPSFNRQLSDSEKQLFVRWIQEGATYERHWAFQRPSRPKLPTISTTEWPKNPLDFFVLSKLQGTGLAPSPSADRATLIKRLSIDLIGLPPTPAEVAAFVQDDDPQAYEHLVDRLLENEHYGERMALPWLDAARYADSNGFQQDGDTWQWIWRDWLVQALNQDLPFDQLTIWQLAGDLLPNSTTEQKIASAFNRNHLLNGEGGAIAEEQRWVNLFDRINTTATTWLGLTMACAQCHDHKYDPITQRDYYSLLDAFNRVPERGTPKRFSTRIRVDTPFLELPTEENKQRLAALDAQIRTTQAQAESARQQAFETWTATLARESDAFRSLPEEARNLLDLKEPERTNEEQQRLQQLLRDHFDEQHQERLNDLPAVKELQAIRAQRDAYQKDQIPRLMIMSDDRPRETHILSRGEYLKPTERVSFAPPAFLPPLSPDAPQNRLGLARWLVDDHHPLTSRVQVNRMWQHFFGQGIVKTAEDFGVQSEYPIHQDLLDWLAVEFRESGWSIKHMHRLIVTSATYQQSSKVTAAHRKWDPENRLYARASRFRMPAMILRDWALAAAGLLDRTRGGAPVYPYQPDNVWEALAITKERDFTYPTSSGRDLFRRSLYTFWRRTVRPANMFDSSNRQACRVRSGTTSTPLHALTTMNDPTWVEAARMLAEQSLQHASSLDQQLHHAFQRVLCRAPDAQEQALLKGAYQRQWALYQADGKAARQLLAVGESDRNPNLAPPQHAALTAVCLGILNLDESLTRE